MARTQAADYEERRVKMLEIAADLFAQRGFTAASVADLAAACETSKSLVYHYFPSKEDMLYELITTHLDQLVEDAAEVFGSKASAEERLNQLIHSFMRHYSTAGNRQKVLLNDLVHLPAEQQATIVAKQRKIVATMQQLLIELTPALADDPVRARVHTMVLLGMINFTHTWYDPKGVVGTDELADIVSQIIAKAMRSSAT